MSAAFSPRAAIPAGVEPPSAAECVAVWPKDTRVPTDSRCPHPALWLMGCHGGAGVSTLEAWLSVAGDCQRSWPGGHLEQTPYVLLVAEESVTGLEQANLRLRQFRCHMAGESNQLVGLVTVARVPGRRPAAISQSLDMVASLAGQTWEIPYIDGMRAVSPRALSTWRPGDPPPERRRRGAPITAVPPEVSSMGAELVASIRSSFQTKRPGTR